MNPPVAIVTRPVARADVQDIYDNLERSRPGSGDSFEDRLNEILNQAAAMPGMYAKLWQEVRAANIPKSQYVVYYLDLSDHIEVIAVMDGARRESAWQKRA